MSKENLESLRKKVAKSIERSEMSPVELWLDDNAAYLELHPNEPIYAHTLLKAMRAVAETTRGLR